MDRLSGNARFEEEGTAMNKTRMIGLSALAVLVALGTGWAIEKSTHSQAQGKPAVIAPAKASGTAATPVPREPEIQPAAVDSNQEYDRSDLLLSQG
jgi:hypothetical protein